MKKNGVEYVYVVYVAVQYLNDPKKYKRLAGVIKNLDLLEYILRKGLSCYGMHTYEKYDESGKPVTDENGHRVQYDAEVWPDVFNEYDMEINKVRVNSSCIYDTAWYTHSTRNMTYDFQQLEYDRIHACVQTMIDEVNARKWSIKADDFARFLASKGILK